MVTDKTDYADPHIDTDLDSYNINFTKKKRIEDMPDILYARILAENLESKSDLDFQVCHRLEGDILPNDFLFSTESWMHPGEIVDFSKFFVLDAGDIQK
jgi:hypothetical protein